MKEKAESSVACNHHRVGFLGLLVTLGIVLETSEHHLSM